MDRRKCLFTAAVFLLHAIAAEGACPAEWSLGTDGYCHALLHGDSGGLPSAYHARKACQDVGADITPGAEDSTLTITENTYVGINRINTTGWVALDGSTPSVTWSTETDGEYCAMATTGDYISANCDQDLGHNSTACRQPEIGSPSPPVADQDNVFYLSYNVDPCSSNPCGHSANCSNRFLDPVCTCTVAYTGTFCNTAMCDVPAICNAGTCSMLGDEGYNCTCHEAFSGVHCETLIDPCYSSPCHHNSTCTTESETTYSCSCVDGTSGEDCETDVDECSSSPCANGGICTDQLGSFSCDCVNEFTGPTCDQVVMCEEPTPVANTTVVFEGLGFNHAATYNCTEDFLFPDRAHIKVANCQDNRWQPEIPPCGPHCPELPGILHGDAVEPTSTMVGHSQNYSCILGHYFSQWNSTFTTIHCDAPGVWDPATVPDCAVVTCPWLPDYVYQELNTDNNTYDTTVTLWCEVGYSLPDDTTARTIYCKADGDWSAELPTCDGVQCPVIPPLLNAQRSSEESTYGAEVMFTCDSGNRMWDGASSRTIKCDAAGQWSDNVTDCLTTRCYPLPYVAKAIPDTLAAEYGTVVTFTCIRGHRFYDDTGLKHASKEMTCLENGHWDPIFSECLPVRCPVLVTELLTYSTENVTADSTDNLYSAVVQLVCDRGHYFADNSTSIGLECMENERWNRTAPYPSCVPVQCIAPPEISNGSVAFHASPYFYQQPIYYTCQVEHRFIDGYNTRNVSCDEFGHWDEPDVSCRKERCEPVPPVVNASPDTTNTSWYTIVNYTCNAGYEWRGQAGRFNATECENTGSWKYYSDDLDDCKPKECPTIPDIANAAHNGSSALADRIYGAYIEYSCNLGFKFPDDTIKKVRACDQNGLWSPSNADFQNCEYITCPPPMVEIDNATITPNKTEYRYGEDVTYQCLEGYQFPDKARFKTVQCTTEAENTTEGIYEWFTFASPLKAGNYCEVVFCPPVPSAWSESWFNSTINEFQSTILYHCNDNYTFVASVQSDPAYTDLFQEIWPNNIMVPTVTPDDTTGQVQALTSYCGQSKQWSPPIAKCVSTISLREGLQPVEAKEAIPIGTVTITLLSVLLVLLILLDLNKLYGDLKMAHANVRDLCSQRRNRKVTDSNIAIGESKC